MMQQRGRQSAATLAMVRGPSSSDTVAPPAGSTAAETALFRKMVANAPHNHFRKHDDELLLSFCQITLMVRKLGDAPKDLKFLAQAMRTQGILAAKLRLAPSARMGARSAGREATATPRSAYETMDLSTDD